MRYGCCYKNGRSASIDVCVDVQARTITVEVHSCGVEPQVDKVFPADKFGEALDLYQSLVQEIEHGAA